MTLKKVNWHHQAVRSVRWSASSVLLLTACLSQSETESPSENIANNRACEMKSVGRNLVVTAMARVTQFLNAGAPVLRGAFRQDPFISLPKADVFRFCRWAAGYVCTDLVGWQTPQGSISFAGAKGPPTQRTPHCGEDDHAIPFALCLSPPPKERQRPARSKRWPGHVNLRRRPGMPVHFIKLPSAQRHQGQVKSLAGTPVMC